MARMHALVGVSARIAGAVLLLNLLVTSLLLAGPRDDLAAKGVAYTPDAFVERAGVGDLEAVKLFLAAGMDVNAVQAVAGRPFTALYASASQGRIEVVRYLVEQGADVNGRIQQGSYLGNTALLAAASAGDLATVSYLLDRGATVNVRNQQDQTPLLSASISGKADVVKLLASKGADVNARGGYGQTAIIFAATYGSADTVRALIDLGADVNVRDHNLGQTALDRATNPDVVRMLRAAGGKKASELR